MSQVPHSTVQTSVENQVPQASPSTLSIVPGSGAAPFGNFHTYYKFNPADKRLEFFPSDLADALCASREIDPVASEISFLDIGCNEGDISSGFASLLVQQCQSARTSRQPKIQTCESKLPTTNPAVEAIGLGQVRLRDESIHFEPNTSQGSAAQVAPSDIQRIRGVCVDLDSLLIARAKRRHVTEATQTSGTSSPQCTLHFIHGNITDTCTQQEVESYLRQNRIEASSPSISDRSALTPPRFDVVLLLSVTMWIHVHHGDEGLKNLLKWVTEHTRNIIIELHEWRSYQTLMKRWKKAGQAVPEAMATLEWRQDVDDRVLSYLQDACGFVVVRQLAETHWSRKLVWLALSTSSQTGARLKLESKTRQ